MNLNSEWDSNADADEVNAAPENIETVAPANGVATATAEPGVAQKPISIPMMPAHDPNVHTVTPTPEGTHPGADGELPKHLKPVTPEERAKAKSKFALPVPPPTDLREAFIFHQKLNQLKPLSNVELEEKNIAVALFGKHLHKLQQMPEPAVITSQTYGNQGHVQHDFLRRERLKTLARQEPLIDELLKERDALLSGAKNWKAIALQNLEIYLDGYQTLIEESARLNPGGPDYLHLQAEQGKTAQEAQS